MKASELRPGQFFELEGERYQKVIVRSFWFAYIDKDFVVHTGHKDTEVNPDCPQCWGEGEEVREAKLPFWQFHSMASRLASMPCENKSYSQCSETDLCITEWCEPCAAKAWMCRHEQACTPTPPAPAEQKQ